MHLEHTALIVESYDEAIRFFVDALGFELVEDSPSTTNDGRAKRWVVVRPPGGQTGLLLAQADGDQQAEAVGRQYAGRVGLFLRVDDFDTGRKRMLEPASSSSRSLATSPTAASPCSSTSPATGGTCSDLARADRTGAPRSASARDPGGMSDRSFPIISARDLVAVRAFYERLGFVQTYQFPPDGEPGFVTLERDGSTIGIGAGAAEDHVALWVYVDDVDATLEQLAAAGAPVVAAPEDQPFGERVAQTRDPDGTLVYLGAPAT